jgi:hypothetical protein
MTATIWMKYWQCCLFAWWCLAPLETIFPLYCVWDGQFCFVEETGGLGENHQPVEVTDKLYHLMLCTSPWSRFKLTTSVVIGTDCIGSCKSYYHMITATTAPIGKVGLKPIKIYLLFSTFYMLSYLYILYKYYHWTSNYEEGGVGIQLWRREVWDPITKKGGLGSNYEEGRVGIQLTGLTLPFLVRFQIRVITKLPISEQSSKGKVKTYKYINRQNQSTTGKLGKP